MEYRKKFWYGMEWTIFRMEWKKIACMEYGKISFHSISYHALFASHQAQKITVLFGKDFCIFFAHFHSLKRSRAQCSYSTQAKTFFALPLPGFYHTEINI